MASGIKVEGFDELTEYLEGLELDPVQEKAAVRKSLDVIKKEVEPDIPVGATGILRESQSTSIRQKDGVTIGEYRLNAFYAIFLELGTSHSKKHVGFFSRATRRAEEEAIETLSSELLK